MTGDARLVKLGNGEHEMRILTWSQFKQECSRAACGWVALLATLSRQVDKVRLYSVSRGSA